MNIDFDRVHQGSGVLNGKNLTADDAVIVVKNHWKALQEPKKPQTSDQNFSHESALQEQCMTFSDIGKNVPGPSDNWQVPREITNQVLPLVANSQFTAKLNVQLFYSFLIIIKHLNQSIQITRFVFHVYCFVLFVWQTHFLVILFSYLFKFLKGVV